MDSHDVLVRRSNRIIGKLSNDDDASSTDPVVHGSSYIKIESVERPRLSYPDPNYVLGKKYVNHVAIHTGSSSVVTMSSYTREPSVRSGLKSVVAIKFYSEDGFAREKKILAAVWDSSRVVPELFTKVIGSVKYNKHHCMVMDLYSMNLGRLLSDGKFTPFSGECVKFIGSQILDGLRFLNGIGITHASLNLEKVLLLSDPTSASASTDVVGSRNKHVLERPQIRIVGFSHSLFSFEYGRVNVSDNRCGPPELLNELSWSKSVDAFSVGCIVSELHVGRILFPVTGSSRERLSVLEILVGRFNARFIEQYKQIDPHAFTPDSPPRVNYGPHSPDASTRKHFPPHSATYALSDLKPVLTLISDRGLGTLVRGLLAADPSDRTTVVQALDSGYFDIL
ncbi:hypothetical protein PLICRDRAFT_171542 [Plicaturopsis crispa FD-325 SS-3]|nr:hypothetical protein PLICRDRAFT_171542 [Plicaturopsis crispa FD-325 SS-3]